MSAGRVFPNAISAHFRQAKSQLFYCKYVKHSKLKGKVNITKNLQKLSLFYVT